MTDSDNAVTGYTFFEPTTGIARFVRLVFLPYRKVWDTAPTANDVSGIDKSANYLPKVPFNLVSPEDMHRGRLIQYVRNTLGRDVSPYVNDLPDNFVSECLYNVAYDRPLTIDALRLRIGDSLIINPYALTPMYLTMWLLRAFAAELTATASNTLKAQGTILSDLADHVQFAIDRILTKFNASAPDSAIIIEGYSTNLTQDEAITAKKSTLYIAQSLYTPWVEAGGSAELLVADWGLNNHVADDTTITNKDQILAAWAGAQNPPGAPS